MHNPESTDLICISANNACVVELLVCYCRNDAFLIAGLVALSQEFRLFWDRDIDQDAECRDMRRTKTAKHQNISSNMPSRTTV